MDLLVDRLVIVEIKSGSALAEADSRQLFNYQRAANVSVGMLLHFGPKPQFKRFVISSRRPTGEPSASSAAVSASSA
jgi:GxxExxY protein